MKLDIALNCVEYDSNGNYIECYVGKSFLVAALEEARDMIKELQAKMNNDF
jgi:hypothetical protein